MALRKSTQVNNRVAAANADGAYGSIPIFGEHTVVAGQFALNDVIEMIPWPAGTIPVVLKAHVQDLDSNGTPLVTLDFGVLSGSYMDGDSPARTCGTDFAAASNVGQAGGAIDVTADKLLNLTPSFTDRSIGFKVAAAAATLTAGAKIRVAAIFMPTPQGVTIS